MSTPTSTDKTAAPNVADRGDRTWHVTLDEPTLVPPDRSKVRVIHGGQEYTLLWRDGHLWNGGMYIYYTPTQWRVQGPEEVDL